MGAGTVRADLAAAASADSEVAADSEAEALPAAGNNVRDGFALSQTRQILLLSVPDLLIKTDLFIAQVQEAVRVS